ncbi:L domain-like protein [Gonapodya prolifera JEL478]|uniref:L domain-like protein n=1 Tax=Gonapodya prolifera (strain JEL478) TaxID=1344416 RepID=A0A139B0A1_GONPJ|nr:L domain-like protein [Gonapodya prolifera JEL478]|eukprot:KXS22397.1 L domain-like protein [Gonapodya prolifera JEL478]
MAPRALGSRAVRASVLLVATLLLLSLPGPAECDSRRSAHPSYLLETNAAETRLHKRIGLVAPTRPAIQYIPGRLSMTNPITVHIVYYGQWTQSSKTVIEGFIRGLDQSPFWQISKSYYNYPVGHPDQKTFVTGTVKLGQTVVDNYSLGKMLNYFNTTNWDDVGTIILSHIKAGRLPSDTNAIYALLTSNAVMEASSCSPGGRCAFHYSWEAAVSDAKAANQSSGIDAAAPNYKYLWVGAPSACKGDSLVGCIARNVFTSPNGDPDLDAVLTHLAHEIAEAAQNPVITDTTVAWYFKGGAITDEGADQCDYIYGDAIYENGYYYNNEWNGRKYYIQQQWDVNTQLCGPPSNPVPQDCSTIHKLFPELELGNDCCSSGYSDCANGKVISLDLSNQNRAGSVAALVDKLAANLPHLENIFMEKNPLTGTIPNSICSFSNLSILTLYNTSITGTIPSCLGTLPRLFRLKMHNNPGLTGPIPTSLTKLQYLQTLSLSNCNLGGPVPDFSKSPNLAVFLLNDNTNLTGSLVSGGFKKFNGQSTAAPAFDFSLPRTCDLSGTKVCVPKGYVGPSCFVGSSC